MKTKEIKNQALESLTNNWPRAIAIISIILCMHIIFSFGEAAVYSYLTTVGAVSANENIFSGNIYLIILSLTRILLGFVIISPAISGAVWWFIHCVKGHNNSVTTLFVCYENNRVYLKTVFLHLVTGLIGLGLFLPSGICVYAAYRFIQYSYARGANNTMQVIIITCFFILTLCFFVLGILISLRFILSNYLFVLNPDLPIKQILSSSFRIMKKYRKDLLVLILSFAGWLIPGFFIFPLFFIVPYYAMSITVFMNRVIDEASQYEEDLLIRKNTRNILRQKQEY